MFTKKKDSCQATLMSKQTLKKLKPELTSQKKQKTNDRDEKKITSNARHKDLAIV